MTLTEHPLWDELLPYLYVQYGVGRNGARHRIEVREPLPEHLRDIEVKCAFDDKHMRPIRRRAGWGSLFLSVACPLHVSWRCARTGAARRECDRIRDLIDRVPVTGGLF